MASPETGEADYIILQDETSCLKEMISAVCHGSGQLLKVFRLAFNIFVQRIDPWSLVCLRHLYFSRRRSETKGFMSSSNTPSTSCRNRIGGGHSQKSFRQFAGHHLGIYVQNIGKGNDENDNCDNIFKTKVNMEYYHQRLYNAVYGSHADPQQQG